MGKRYSTSLRRLFNEQAALLNREPIARCENRRGLRRQTGYLLETAFLELAKSLAPDLSVEIGAHEASFSRRIKSALPNIRALAFEANPNVHERFAPELSNADVGIDYRLAAVCDHVGTAELRIPVKLREVAFDRANTISGLRRWAHPGFEYESINVPALTIDVAIGSTGNARSVAWIVAEGSQSEILAGGPDFFSRVAAIYIEVEDQERWRGQSLEGEITDRLSAFSLKSAMRDSLARGQCNQVYVRAESDIVGTAMPSILAYLEALRRLVTAA